VDCENKNRVSGDVQRVRPIGDEDLTWILSWVLMPVLRVFEKSRQWLVEGISWRTKRLFQFPDKGTAYNRWLLPLAMRTMHLAATGRYSAVYVTSPPPSMVIVAGIVSAFCHLPVILDLRDPWTQNFTYTYSGIRHALARLLEAWVLRLVRKIIVVSPKQGEDLQDLYPFVRGKVECITNGFDPDDISELPDYADGDRFILTLMGITYDDPKDLFLAIQMNVRSNPTFAKKFIFQWLGANTGAAQIVDDLGIRKNVALYDYLPHQEALERASKSTALWYEVPIVAGSEYVIRGKTFEYLALGRPILGTVPANACVRTIISKACTSRLVSSRSPADIARLLSGAFTDWQEGKLVSNTDGQYVSKFRADYLASRLAAVLEEVSTTSHYGIGDKRRRSDNMR